MPEHGSTPRRRVGVVGGPHIEAARYERWCWVAVGISGLALRPHQRIGWSVAQAQALCRVVGVTRSMRLRLGGGGGPARYKRGSRHVTEAAADEILNKISYLVSVEAKGMGNVPYRLLASRVERGRVLAEGRQRARRS
jgi:hypothetical protein